MKNISGLGNIGEWHKANKGNMKVIKNIIETEEKISDEDLKAIKDNLQNMLDFVTTEFSKAYNIVKDKNIGDAIIGISLAKKSILK